MISLLLKKESVEYFQGSSRACQETMLAIIDTYIIQGLKYQILAQPGPDPQPVQGENWYE